MDAEKQVVVVGYNPSWPLEFERLRSYIWPAVSDLALAIQHVGGTAVPQLAAKPILDIDLVIDGAGQLPAVIKKLAFLGYSHRGDLGISGREAFSSTPNEVKHHLYVCVEGCAAVRNHLTLRDHLRSNAADVAEFSVLKYRLAERFPFDIRAYTAGKTEFVLSILARYAFSDDEVRFIKGANSLIS